MDENAEILDADLDDDQDDSEDDYDEEDLLRLLFLQQKTKLRT